MKASPTPAVQELYDSSGDAYAKMMDAEIETPLYAATLSRLANAVDGLTGPVVDTSCGSGHMLGLYHERYDAQRELVGVDVSPRMVGLAGSRLHGVAQVRLGDMRELSELESESVAGVLNFFALHHVGPEDARMALCEWHRVLVPGGALILGTWEGAGPIDYGDESDIVALRYSRAEVSSWAQAAGFRVDRCLVEPVEGMPMGAVYLDATRA